MIEKVRQIQSVTCNIIKTMHKSGYSRFSLHGEKHPLHSWNSDYELLVRRYLISSFSNRSGGNTFEFLSLGIARSEFLPLLSLFVLDGLTLRVDDS